MSPIITTVLNWGRQAAPTPGQSLVDQAGDFGPEQTEALRRALRGEYQKRTPGVVGSWHKGYELMIGPERVGVTNGYGRFRVYYRCQDQLPRQTPKHTLRDDIPFTGEPVTIEEWAGDYAIPAYC